MAGKPQKNLAYSVLLDFYGPVLTEKQRVILTEYYDEDLSLAEIAENLGITRQGVRDAIKHGEAALDELDAEKARLVTDDCSLFELAGLPVHLTQGDYVNLKITTKEDLPAAAQNKGENTMRIGHGYDVHRLVEGRKLIMGGVTIPYEKGLLGHSDADVLVHAIMDALLGAAALRDIGRHFPDNDPAYEGADSIELLKKVGEMLEERMYLIENIDATVIAQKPKLLLYIDTMVKNVAEALHLEEDQVNIKATTEEGLGFTGKKEGISAQAICCISKALDLMPDDRIAGGCSGCPGCAKNAEE